MTPDDPTPPAGAELTHRHEPPPPAATTRKARRRLGCGICFQGWRGYNTEGQLVACTNCRPHVAEYLQHWDRATRSTLDPFRRAPGPNVPMPDYVRSTYREFAARAKLRAEQLADVTPIRTGQGDLLEDADTQEA